MGELRSPWPVRIRAYNGLKLKGCAVKVTMCKQHGISFESYIFQIRKEELHKYTVLGTIYLVTMLHTKWFFDIIDVVMMMMMSD